VWVIVLYFIMKSGYIFLPNFTFMGLCIVIYFNSKTNYTHNFSSLLNIILHVSDGLSVHHQEFKTVHRASGICHTDSIDCVLARTRSRSR